MALCNSSNTLTEKLGWDMYLQFHDLKNSFTVTGSLLFKDESSKAI